MYTLCIHLIKHPLLVFLIIGKQQLLIEPALITAVYPKHVNSLFVFYSIPVLVTNMGSIFSTTMTLIFFL